MSNKETADIRCEKCGYTFSNEVYTSVNVRQNPELRKKVLEGTFFEYICRSCGHIFNSFYNTLYHDIDRKFMVWLVKPNSDNIIFMQRNSLKIGGLLSNYKLNISRSPFQWVERIVTLELGLDPRLIELYKFGFKNQQNFPLRTQNDFLHFKKHTKSFLNRTKFHWQFVYDDGSREELSKSLNVKKYKSYECLINSMEFALKPTSWYLIDWQFPFGIEIQDDELIQLPVTSDFIEVGQNRTKLPKQFLDITTRTGKGKQE